MSSCNREDNIERSFQKHFSCFIGQNWVTCSLIDQLLSMWKSCCNFIKIKLIHPLALNQFPYKFGVLIDVHIGHSVHSWEWTHSLSLSLHLPSLLTNRTLLSFSCIKSRTPDLWESSPNPQSRTEIMVDFFLPEERGNFLKCFWERFWISQKKEACAEKDFVPCCSLFFHVWTWHGVCSSYGELAAMGGRFNTYTYTQTHRFLTLLSPWTNAYIFALIIANLYLQNSCNMRKLTPL